MNQHFSLRRFGWLLQLDLAENKRVYLLTLALVLGLMLLLMLPILGSHTPAQHLPLHMVAFSICLLLGGSLFSSTAFSAYSSQPQGIATMMVPASKLEKFLVPFLVNLSFMLVFLAIFWGLHYGLVSVVNSRLHNINFRIQPAPAFIVRALSYLYVLAVAATLAGSVWFSKNAFIKTAAVLLTTIVGVFLLNNVLARSFTTLDLFVLPFDQWSSFKGGRMFTVEYPEPVQGLIWVGLGAVVAGLWYLAYVRLKEKEI
jgi:hypothetical protein